MYEAVQLAITRKKIPASPLYGVEFNDDVRHSKDQVEKKRIWSLYRTFFHIISPTPPCVLSLLILCVTFIFVFVVFIRIFRGSVFTDCKTVGKKSSSNVFFSSLAFDAIPKWRVHFRFGTDTPSLKTYIHAY